MKMRYDVVVVGAGNAAMCAALAAQEKGSKVLVLEAAPKDEGGGNSRFTAGAIRCVYNGVDDLREIMPDLTDDEVAITDFGTNSSTTCSASPSTAPIQTWWKSWSSARWTR
jgi:tricarballylate dehydrogenase